MERSEGRDELMKLLTREMELIDGRRQRKTGKGPASWKSERFTELTRPVTESQEMPRQLHGVSSRSFQEERALVGSERLCLTRWRYRPSWFRAEA